MNLIAKFLGALLIAFGLSVIGALAIRLGWRMLRRFLIARAIRRELRSNARADLKALAEEAAARQGYAGHALFTARPWTASAHVEPVAPEEARQAAKVSGRQSIRMPSVGTIYGHAPWSGLTQPGAHEAPWEDYHTFPKGERPTRAFGQLHGGQPIAFVCPGCDLAQPPLTEERRTCGYCGLNIRRHGMRLYWWRVEIEVQEWKPRP